MYIYICIYTRIRIHIYIYTSALRTSLRGWRNAVELVLFEISTSMRPYPSVVHAATNKLRPVISCFESERLDEASNPTPPTSHSAPPVLAWRERKALPMCL